jgi:radical SAM protein with 4Fe4S-binding SPASM domain
MNPRSTVKKFHQFIHLEKGLVNTAIIDLLKGNVYQVENKIIANLEAGEYEKIPEFIKSAVEEDLLIEVKPETWIPKEKLDDDEEEDEEKHEQIGIELHVEEGIDLLELLVKLKGQSIAKLCFYGQEPPGIRARLKQAHTQLVIKEKNFQRCREMVRVDEHFSPITLASYRFNRQYNSCWGAKLAITADGKIHPCIYSEICVGHWHDLELTSIEAIIEKLKPYWKLSKDKVEICKACELRHICFDCREIPCREKGHLTASNPYCSYDPGKGTWGSPGGSL